MSVKIHVDERHIKESQRGDAQHCMVAEAVREQLNVPSGWIVDVDGSTVDIYTDMYGDEEPVSAVLPKHVQEKIERFDQYHPDFIRDEEEGPGYRKDVEPFTFILKLPDDWRTQVANAAKKEK